MPPLELEDYVIVKVKCEANPNCPSDVDDITKPKVKVENELRKKKDEKNNFLSKLTIFFGSEEEPCSYFGEITLMGIFTTREDIPDTEKQDHVGVMGNSMLFSAARDFILTITSRGPNPSMVLPTIRFLKQRKENNEETEGTED